MPHRRLALRLALAVTASCGRGDRAAPDRPSQPTLTLAPTPEAPGAGRRIVASGQIAQPWHVGAWSPASITVPAVQAGDALIVLGVYWGDLDHDSVTAPTDDHGKLDAAVDQGSAIVGRSKPPVFAQLYVELDAAPGAHTITPPYLGGPAGDGTLYVAQVRGLTAHRLIATGQTRVKRPELSDLVVAVLGPVEADDLVIAIGGYDNTEPRGHAGWSAPAPGWTSVGVQDDAATNVPSEVRFRTAVVPGPMAVTWAWTDPTVNVACAVIAVVR